jgi:hypothetical protein
VKSTAALSKIANVFVKIGSIFLKILHISEYANHPKFKPILNTIFLTFSCLLIVTSYTSHVNGLVNKIWCCIVLITLDVAVQWVLGLSKAYWKAKYIRFHHFKAILLILVWFWYVVVFAVPTATGYFMNTFNFQKQQVTIIEDSYKRYKSNYEKNEQTINALNAQLLTESKTGFRANSKDVMKELNKAKAEQATLEILLQNSGKEKVEVSQSSDQSLKTISNFLVKINKVFTEEFLTLLAYLSVVAMIYLFLALTAWEVELPNKLVPENKLSDFKKELLLFLDKAFEGRSGNALNGVEIISEKSGISKERCIQLRNYLSKLKVNGGMAITVGIGSSAAKHTKDFIKNFIVSHDLEEI